MRADLKIYAHWHWKYFGLGKNLIADELKASRKEAGLSQARLSELSGIRIETISRIESKKTGARAGTINKLMTEIRKFIK